eukprot:jgi/Mesvir1/22077/Mv12732-RA.1
MGDGFCHRPKGRGDEPGAKGDVARARGRRVQTREKRDFVGPGPLPSGLRRPVRDKKVGIFQRKSRDGASSAGDHKRHQYEISHEVSTGEFDIWRTCHSLVTTFFSSKYLVVNPCFLYSDAGCAQQSAHRDFLSDIHRWRCDFPISALVALEDDTRFVAYESICRGNGINETADDLEGDVTPREIVLSPGNMLMWHGNLVHAGGAYPLLPNRRLFFSAVAVDDGLSIPMDYTFHVTV